jgi:hypothetical protein
MGCDDEEGMWEEAIMAHFTVQSRYLHRGIIKNNTLKASVKMFVHTLSTCCYEDRLRRHNHSVVTTALEMKKIQSP